MVEKVFKLGSLYEEKNLARLVTSIGGFRGEEQKKA
jgi:hypothetical protein